MIVAVEPSRREEPGSDVKCVGGRCAEAGQLSQQNGALVRHACI